MTRRLSTTPRRLRRSRPPTRRCDHAGDVALPGLRPVVVVAASPQPQRDTDRALRSLTLENAMLARELGRVQQRCTQWRDDCIVQNERLEATLMRARADNIVKETQMASLRDALDALQKRAAVWLTNEALVRRLGDLRARNRSLEFELAEAQRAIDGLRVSSEARRPAADDAPRVEQPLEAPPTSNAGRVLCIGGRARQVPVYRELVERRGGRFTHVEGTSAECLGDLARRLGDADVVILQAGYVCQGACRAVETHCARTGLRCVRLDKACALGFERCLDEALSTAS